MKIELIEFTEGFQKPYRAHDNDAGADVYLQQEVILKPHMTEKIPLGFGIKIPDGYMGLIYPRSSMAYQGLVCQLPPIDSGYRGEIHAIVSNLTDMVLTIEAGTRIGQLVVQPIVIPTFVDEKHDGKVRGFGAFGSTGK